MPKVTSLSEIAANKERLRANLNAVKYIIGGTNEKLAKIMGVSAVTVGNRFRNPDSLTCGEVRRICKAAKISCGNFIDGTLMISAKDDDEKSCCRP